MWSHVASSSACSYNTHYQPQHTSTQRVQLKGFFTQNSVLNQTSLLHSGVTCVFALLREIRFATMNSSATDNHLISASVFITFSKKKYIYIVLFYCYMFIEIVHQPFDEHVKEMLPITYFDYCTNRTQKQINTFLMNK